MRLPPQSDVHSHIMSLMSMSNPANDEIKMFADTWDLDADDRHFDEAGRISHTSTTPWIS